MAQSKGKSIWTFVVLANLMTLAAGLLTVMQNMSVIPYIGDTVSNYAWHMIILYPLGALFGSIISGYLAQRFGIKPTLLLLGALFALTFLLIAIFGSSDSVAIYVAQFSGGFASAGLLIVLPVFIVEVAESRNRGRLASMIHFFYCLGNILILLLIVLLMNIIGVAIAGIIFVAISVGVVHFLLHETPQYLILKKQEANAKQSLQAYRSTQGVDDEYLEIRDITLTQSSSTGVLHAIALFVFRALSGVQITLNYGFLIQQRDDGVTDYFSYNIFMIFVPLIASILAICLMDTVGRRTILAMSTVGIFIAQLIIGVYIEPVELNKTYGLLIVCTTMVTILYSVGIATLPFIVAAELQASNKKPLVLGITASITWLLQFVISGYYYSIAASLGETSVFWFFPVINVVAIVYYAVFLPETMKQSAKQINDILK